MYGLPICKIWFFQVPHTLYGIGVWGCHLTLYGIGIIWSSPHVHMFPQHVPHDSYGPHTWHGIGILWSPTCTYGPPTFEVSSCLIWLLWSLHTLYGIGIIWSPTCMYGSTHVWYDFFQVPHTLYGVGIWWPPTLYRTGIIWSPTYMYGSPNMYYMSLMVPHTLYGICILWSPLTSYGTGIIWFPHIYIWSLPHVKCLHVWYDSYGPIPYME